MITGIGHTAYDVADMDKSIDLYCKKLGLTDALELKNPQSGEPWIRYIMAAPGQFIELFYNRKGENNKVSYSHLCLKVDDIEKIHALMIEKDIPIDVAPKQGSDGNWQCWTHDPDGNRIEFMQMSPESMQSKAEMAR